jgi:hypothetical protein
MKSILILSTCYDSNSSYTASWAQDLHDDLVKQSNVSCFLYNAQYLCRAGTALAEAVERADYVVFYGHGMKDSWIALPDLPGATPSVATIPLIDSSSVGVLQGRKVYAGCCWSLNGLGSNYVAKFPQGEYVGYSHEFGFEAANESYFKEVVNQSVSDFINGDPATTVANNLRTEWALLRTRFYSGNLKTRRNAVMASKVADLNSQRIGSRP